MRRARKGLSAAEDKGRYVICVQDAAGDCELLVYDPARGLWHREDGLQVRHMARADKETWMADSAEQVLWSRNGTLLMGHPGNGHGGRGELAAETADWNQKDAGKAPAPG